MMELRPEWCAPSDEVPAGLTLAPWEVIQPVSMPIETFDGDDWVPGRELSVSREVDVDDSSLRRTLGVSAAVRFGIAARWYCARSNLAGTHTGGPRPLVGSDRLDLVLRGDLSGSVELETDLVVLFAAEGDPPVGSVVWSDAWSDEHGSGPTTLVLEGDEFRVPVVLVDFDSVMPANSRAALWHISLDMEADLDDPAANVITVQLNARLVADRFDGDMSHMHPSLLQTIRMDMLRHVALRFLPGDEPRHPEPDSLGELVWGVAGAVDGSWAEAAKLLAESPAEFDTALWSAFAEGAW